MSRHRCSWEKAAALAVGLSLAARIGTLLVNAATFPHLRRPAGPPPDLSGVSLLVPARDEAHNLPGTLPGLLRQGAGEVIVLDDGSRDGTAELARSLGARVIAGQPLPPGWRGKPWACQQLGAAASGSVLVFTDADVTWQPGALAALLDAWTREDADLLSVWPRQDNRSPGERFLTPMVDTLTLGLLPWPLLRWPQPALSAANGQVMAFRRRPYQEEGGHALVRGELLEDFAFARRFKERGRTLTLVLGGDLISVRMYRSYRKTLEGFGKNSLAAHGGHRAGLALGAVAVFFTYSWPYLTRNRTLVALGLAEALLVRVITRRTRPDELAEVLLTPLIAPAGWPSYLLAARRQVAWKGRRYQQ
ncbi:glycosyltransferase [Deinococcus sp. SL84]|uniref:glycosyltransferase n=1 Tax=Deinococcus sp. SL84 TaxID=2994663 RepID=UPI00227625EC|nr:glycosyltransferase [Deinococcus sp. SL84]MCY1702995.1 glycosyltransferase [Deinococcus sp. SL84]